MQGWFFFHFRFKTSESVVLQVDHWEVGSWGMYPRVPRQSQRGLYVCRAPKATRSVLSFRFGLNRTRKAIRPRTGRWVQGLVSSRNELSFRGRECSLLFTCFLSPLTGTGVMWGRSSARSIGSVAKGHSVTIPGGSVRNSGGTSHPNSICR